MGTVVDFTRGKIRSLAKGLGVEIRDAPNGQYVLIDTFLGAPVLSTSSTDEVFRFLKRLPAIKDAAPLT